MGATREFRSDRRFRSGAVFAACFTLAAIAATDPLWAVRREKTVFRSQPTDWAPLLDDDEKQPSLVFEPSWTWSGFKAPLAGDPVLCSGAIVAASRDGEIVALEPIKGEPVWQARLEEPVAGVASDGTTLLVTGARGRLWALRGQDGSALWKIDLPSAPAVAPSVIGTRVLVGTEDGTLLSIETGSGRIAATCLLPGRPSTPAEPAPGAVLVGTDHGALLALRESDLEVLFRHDADAAITSPPVFDDSRVWFAAADRSVRCVRFKNGKKKWTGRTGATCTARPVVSGPYLYLLSFDNDIYVFNKRNGHQMTRVRMGHRLEADATVAQNHLLVVPFTEASLVGLALPYLQKVGRFDLQAPGEWFTTAPLWAADRVALGYGRNEGRVVALLLTEQATLPAGEGKPAPEGKQPPPSTGAIPDATSPGP
jgi:outer membrane protein assembly factor BamB